MSSTPEGPSSRLSTFRSKPARRCTRRWRRVDRRTPHAQSWRAEPQHGPPKTDRGPRRWPGR
jgi:hypothetical protein